MQCISGLAGHDEEIQQLRIPSTTKIQCRTVAIIDGMNTTGKIRVWKSDPVKSQAVLQWRSALRKVVAAKLDMSVSDSVSPFSIK